MSGFADRIRAEDDTDQGRNPKKFFGKYRGIVVDNLDPEHRNRILAIVPDVSNVIPLSWAEACMPPGHAYTPMFGAGVWIEFEQGDLDYPIWTGCFLGSALEVPLAAEVTPPGVPQTTIASPVTQHSITVSDSPVTGVLLRTPGLATISLTDAGGVIITNGKGATIAMNGPTITITGIVQVA
jgi:hypothetical protein